MSLDWLAENIDQVPDIGPVPPGNYDLRLLRFYRAKQVEDKGGREYFQAVVEVENAPTAAEMVIFLGFVPDKKPETKDEMRDVGRIKKFLRLFALPQQVLADANWTEGDQKVCESATGATAKDVFLAMGKDNRDGRSINVIQALLR